MGARPSRRQESKEETRRELVEAASRVFVRDGFHGASVDRIAREAGYTTGAVYWHFRGKDDLFLAAVESHVLTRVEEIGEVHETASGGLAARARALADQWMERHADRGFMVVMLEFFVHALRHPELRAALATQHAAVRLSFGRALEAMFAEEGVEPPMPVQDIATAMREQGVGLAMARLLDPDGVPDNLHGDFVETFFELLVERPVRAQDPTRAAS